MPKKIDIIDVRTAVRNGELKVFILNGYLSLEDTKSGERVVLKEAVVPCMECKHYVWNAFGDGCYVCAKHGKHGFRPKDFCSYGERKDNDST